MRLLIALVSVCLLISCSSGSSGNKSNHNPHRDFEVNEPEKFSLGGTIQGLKGSVELQLGDESLILSESALPSDGSFVFQTKFVLGSRYDVKIVQLPENQLCELQNSRDFILRDRDDLYVHCASMVEVDIELDVPNTYELTDLRLLSNYQAKGGNGELPISSRIVPLLVFDNSFVSLRNQQGKLIYLSFIDDTNKGLFKLNALSTALALLLLDPTVANAIHDRDLPVDSVLEDLKTAVSDNNALNDLVGEIALLAESRKDLLAESDSLITDLQRVLDLAIAYLESLPLPTHSEIASVGQSGKSVVELQSAGVTFEYVRAAFDEDVLINVTNQRQRYLTLSADKLGKVILAPGEDYKATLAGGVPANSAVNIYVSGLGKLGELPNERQADYLSAARLSGLKQRFLPSVSLMLGLSQPGDFSIPECLSDSDMDNLLTALETSALSTAFVESRLSEALLMLNHLARQRFVKTHNNSSPLNSLFACEKLGVGLLFDDQKAIAKDNISGILQGLNTIFDPANGLQGLLGAASATELNQAMEDSVRTAHWQLSNFLQVSVTFAPSDEIYPEQEVSFTGTCTDPNTQSAVECDIVWDFGDGESGEGAQVGHSYSEHGVYTVEVNATDADGASSTQSIQLEVLPFNPELHVYVNALPLVSGELGCDFGVVPVGDKRSCDIEIANLGEGDLVFGQVNGSDGDFSWSIASDTVLPQAHSLMTIEFAPSQAGELSSGITLSSNDPDSSSFVISVRGEGDLTLPVAWQVRSESETKAFSAIRQLVREVQIGGSTYLNIQLFADAVASSPQLRLLLPFDSTDPDRQYVLDDTAASECLGSFVSADSTAPYCTRTSGLFAGQPLSGLAELSTLDGGDGEGRSLVFEFDAVPSDCLGPEMSCEQVMITGSVSISIP